MSEYKNKTMQQLGELKPWEQQEHNTSEDLETVVHQGASFQYSSESLLRVGGGSGRLLRFWRTADGNGEKT